MTSVKKLLLVLGILAVVLGGTSSLLAQDQLNLHDGGLNNLFTGGNSQQNPHQINLTMESQNCPGQLCSFAISTAMGTGHLQSSGNYSITTPKGAPVMGGFAGPFFLTVQPDGHSTVTQTAPVTLNYNSAQGTLTGSLTFTSVSATSGCCSTALATFTATGGSFAQFFPSGGSVTFSFGLSFPLQNFPLVPHAQSVLEFQSGTITANAPQLVLTCASGVAQVGVPYDSFLVASGGVPPYTYSIASGSLPPGLTLNPATGEISGTPTMAGTFNYVAQAVDSIGNTVQTNCSIIVSPPGLVLTCASGTGQVNVPYDSFLTASGGTPPYTFSISSGSLPPGLTLNPSTGEISGTPTMAGTFNYTAKVTDSTGAMATTSCSITIRPPGLALTCSSGTAQVGVPYDSFLVATGGVPPYTFAIAAGSLPPGLTLNPATGEISGTPTMAGTFNFTAQVTDSTGAFIQTPCSITVAPPQLTLTCASGSAQVGVPYDSFLTATGGVPPYTFSIIAGSLPPGLTLNASTGEISGTPTMAGTFNYTAQVTDSTGAHIQTQCSITVAPPPLVLTCASGTGQVGVPYDSFLVASGGAPPYTYSIASGSLPPGLTLNPSTGEISGTPTMGGTFNYVAKATDSLGNMVQTNCSIVITQGLSIACVQSTGIVGQPYNSQFTVVGGVAPFTFSIISGSLPPGLTLNPSTGAVTGTPTSEGTFSFTVKVTDSQGNMATANCSITISTCGTSLTPINYNVNEGQQQQGEIAWFNSHLTKLSGTIPTSSFQIYITGGHLTFGNLNLAVPDAVLTFSTTAACAQTTFNTALNRFESTYPLSAASSADEIFAAGLAFQVPTGIQNVNNVTWSADISASAPGIIASWQFGASNWFLTRNGFTFPNLSQSPFVPDYNGMMIKSVHNAPSCIGQPGDHAGAPEFANRGQLLTGGGSGGGGSNWTGSWSSTPRGVRICDPNGMLGACLASPVNNAIAQGSSFAAIGLEGSHLQINGGPLQLSGNLGVGLNGRFQVGSGQSVKSKLYADPSAHIALNGSNLAGGRVNKPMSSLQTAATGLSNWAASLSPTQTFGEITSATTLTGNGGQNVVNVTGAFRLSGVGSDLTISGGASDTFIVNAPAGMQLEKGANIVLSGVTPRQVLFNFPAGSSGQVQLSGQSRTAGIFLAPYLQMQIDGGVHNSEFISGGQLSFDSDTVVNAPACTQ